MLKLFDLRTTVYSLINLVSFEVNVMSDFKILTRKSKPIIYIKFKWPPYKSESTIWRVDVW